MIAEGLARQNGDDLRRDPLEVRKATLRSMLAKAGLGIRFNEHSDRLRPCLRWGSKASCRSGRTRLTAPGARRIG
jgi:hypothetical protein